MAGQRGRDVLVKIAEADGSFVTIAGIRTRSIELNASAVDGTSADSPNAWRELVAGAGVKSARVQGAGVFKDRASDERMRALFFAGEVADWQLVIPDFGALTGPFQITELSYSGRHDGEAEFSVTIQSAGELGFEVAS